MIGDFHFIRPLWLIALIPLALLSWNSWRAQDMRKRAEKVIAPHLLSHLVMTPASQTLFRPVYVLFLLWAVTVLALAGPSWKRQPNPLTEDEAALYVLLNVSGSMKSTDVQPSRLERAKHKLSDLLELRAGAPTGLIVYSGSAHLVMPPTTDGRILIQMVEELEPEMMPSEGNALNQAIRLADRLFTRAGQSGSVVVFADKIEAADLDEPVGFPVQVLAFAPLNSSVPTISLSVDDADVRQVAARAAKAMTIHTDESGGVRWQDAGFYLVPLIFLLTLLPFRKGWVVA